MHQICGQTIKILVTKKGREGIKKSQSSVDVIYSSPLFCAALLWTFPRSHFNVSVVAQSTPICYVPCHRGERAGAKIGPDRDEACHSQKGFLKCGGE